LLLPFHSVCGANLRHPSKRHPSTSRFSHGPSSSEAFIMFLGIPESSILTAHARWYIHKSLSEKRREASSDISVGSAPPYFS
jgi:hypothetical protein